MDKEKEKKLVQYSNYYNQRCCFYFAITNQYKKKEKEKKKLKIYSTNIFRNNFTKKNKLSKLLQKLTSHIRFEWFIVVGQRQSNGTR